MTHGNWRSYFPRVSRLSSPLILAGQERLWSACSPLDFREQLVLGLLLEMGLRSREVCALTVPDVQTGRLSVIGKSGQIPDSDRWRSNQVGT